MSTDKNRFDSWLKEDLYRDIIYRVFLWASISGSAVYLATGLGQLAAVEYFEQVGKGIMPLLNIVGTIALILLLLAMMFKDLEYVDDFHFGQARVIGCIGGFVRRTAGDLSLWVLGAVVAIFTSASVAVFAEATTLGLGLQAVLQLTRFYALILLMFLGIACLSVLVRREEPPTSSLRTAPALLRSLIP
ncbi:MAG: hypothetical protein IT585_12595 [candidate division Zixibacteria bacterium]|nr:hypothetical protein [candidate division Zixibacteria bacterium]